jgi:hypothetical protein
MFAVFDVHTDMATGRHTHRYTTGHAASSTLIADRLIVATVARAVVVPVTNDFGPMLCGCTPRSRTH